MQALNKKIILITGASSGIGEACAKQCAFQGANLIITARRLDKLEKLANELKTQYQISALPLQLDVRDKEAVKSMIHQLPSDWQAIDILINNAGLALGNDTVEQGKLNDWDTMIDTNIKGLMYVTRYVLNGMIERHQGHIVNISSVAGSQVYPGGNIYCATKHAVKAFSEALRLDLLGKPIRVTDIAPGAVETEFSRVRWNNQKKSDEFYKDFTSLIADDIADTVVYCITRPKHVNISEMLVMPTDQASVNFIHRQ
ncbi:MAG: SDR family oxidoreductase [Gammaproteobacteria bacterium]